MSGVVLYSGDYIAPFDGDEALEALLDECRGSDFEDEAAKLALCVCGGYGRTLELTSGYWSTRFSSSLRYPLNKANVRLKAGTGRALFVPRQAS